MSELKNIEITGNCRSTLLATASIFALLAAFPIAVRADETGSTRPTVWMELGGQFERSNSLGDKFEPAFLGNFADSPIIASGAPLNAQDSRFSYGGEGKISFEPRGIDWIFSASILYGRASGRRHIHQSQGVDFPKSLPIYNSEFTRYGHHSADTKLFSDTVSKSAESHTLLDFQVGKDFGLGLFGSHSTSDLSFGIRFAQFSSSRDVMFRARPDLHFYDGFLKYWHTYGVHEVAKRSFTGLGPSLSWNNDTPLFGSDDDGGGVTLDWGVDAAILFGRQKASVHHNSTIRTFRPFIRSNYKTSYPPTANHSRSRSVVTPNLGGFGGVSFRYAAARVSFGYRADFFFGAIDAGNDARRTQVTGIYGPFATVSLGLGG